MSNILRVSAALALLIGAGLVHGSWTSRWRPAPALLEMAERLQKLPLETRGWTATARTLPPRELAMTGAVGYISRIYHNSSKGLNISVLLLSGLPGDISTHTPDVCYPGAGYTLDASTRHVCRYGSPEVPAEFRTAVAKKGGVNPSVLRIYWGWRGSKGWSAPEDPRWAFGSEPVLTKLYVVRETSGQAADPKDDPCDEFMSQLLAELDSVISPAAGHPAADSASAPVASTASR